MAVGCGVPHGLPDVLLSLPAVDHSEARESAPLDRVAKRLGYRFERPALLRVALTVGSWANENRNSGWPSNACLEFFGDAVLDLAAAHALWRRFPELEEGALTRLRSTLVSERALAEVAAQIDLGACLWVGRGDEPEGRARPSTLADAFEAVLGSVYLDARAGAGEPMLAAESVFDRIFGERVAEMTPDDGLDPKSRLQQLVQGKLKRTPRYEAVGEPPPPQDPHWVVRVWVAGEADERNELGPDELGPKELGPKELGRGEGRSLRAAERAAAADALARLRRQPK